MFYAPQKVDSKKRWAAFLNQDQWESLKNNIEEYYIFIKSLNDKRITTDNGIQGDSPSNEGVSEQSDKTIDREALNPIK